MSRLIRRLSTAVRSIAAPTTTVRAHCDLPCGVYDPEQARIEAESCYKIIEKYAANEDATFRARAIGIKERQAELVKHHLDVLWHDYFKPEHLEKVPNLHELFWNANKQVSKVKASTDLADAKTLLSMIDDIDAAWKATGGEEKTRVNGRPS
jgi:nickel superoxide dismutase